MGLELVAERARLNTLSAQVHDLKVFFSIVEVALSVASAPVDSWAPETRALVRLSGYQPRPRVV